MFPHYALLIHVKMPVNFVSGAVPSGALGEGIMHRQKHGRYWKFQYDTWRASGKPQKEGHVEPREHWHVKPDIYNAYKVT